MTDHAEDVPDRDDDFLAAELALGLSEGEALAEGRDRVLRDRAFALQVAGWQERFVAMTDAIKPVRPKRRVKKAILAQVFPRVHVPLSQRLWLWQGITLATLVLAAYLAAPLLRPGDPDRVAAPIYSATLTGDIDELQVFAVLDPARLGIALRRVAGNAPQGRVLELWAILPDAAPVSLGVVPEDGVHLPLPPELAEQLDILTLAISDEPPGGAPDGAPTGSIRAVGSVSEI